MTLKEILAAEKADPCPFGRVRVSNDEIDIVAESLRKNSNFLISDTAARNLAYLALVALRSKHFDWWQRHD